MEGKNWGCFSSPLNPTFIIPLPCITPVLRCQSPLSSSMDPSICNINWETLPSRPPPKAQTSGWTSWRGGAIGKLRLEECAKMGVEVLFERLHASSSKFHQQRILKLISPAGANALTALLFCVLPLSPLLARSIFYLSLETSATVLFDDPPSHHPHQSTSIKKQLLSAEWGWEGSWWAFVWDGGFNCGRWGGRYNENVFKFRRERSGELREQGDHREGRVRVRVPVHGQQDAGGGGDEEGDPGHGERGLPQHFDPRDLPAARDRPQERRHPEGRGDRPEAALPDLRVPGQGPARLHGGTGQSADGAAEGQEVPLPDARGHRRLPHEAHHPPRPQAGQHPARHQRQPQDRGLRTRQDLLHPRASLLRGSGHALVPRALDPAGVDGLLHAHRHLGHRLHLRGNGDEAAPVRGGQRAGPAVPHLPHPGHSQRGDLARRHQAQGLQVDLPQLASQPDPERRQRTHPRHRRPRPPQPHAPLRPQRQDHRQGRHAAPLLQGALLMILHHHPHRAHQRGAVESSAKGGVGQQSLGRAIGL